MLNDKKEKNMYEGVENVIEKISIDHNLSKKAAKEKLMYDLCVGLMKVKYSKENKKIVISQIKALYVMSKYIIKESEDLVDLYSIIYYLPEIIEKNPRLKPYIDKIDERLETDLQEKGISPEKFKKIRSHCLDKYDVSKIEKLIVEYQEKGTELMSHLTEEGLNELSSEIQNSLDELVANKNSIEKQKYTEVKQKLEYLLNQTWKLKYYVNEIENEAKNL